MVLLVLPRRSADPCLELDVCRSCRLVWIDPGETDHLPLAAREEVRRIRRDYSIHSSSGTADGRARTEDVVQVLVQPVCETILYFLVFL